MGLLHYENLSEELIRMLWRTGAHAQARLMQGHEDLIRRRQQEGAVALQGVEISPEMPAPEETEFIATRQDA